MQPASLQASATSPIDESPSVAVTDQAVKRSRGQGAVAPVEDGDDGVDARDDGVDVLKPGAVVDRVAGTVVVLGCSPVAQAASAVLSRVALVVGTPPPPRSATSRSSSSVRTRS